MDKAPPLDDFDDNPEWTDETQARSRLASEMFPPHIANQLINPASRSADATDSVVVRLDKEVLARLKADGPDWERRINDTLRKAVGL